MTTKKQKFVKISESQVRPKSELDIIEGLLKNTQKHTYYRQTGRVTEVIIGNRITRYMESKSGEFRAGAILFSSVSNQLRKAVAAGAIPKFKVLPTNKKADNYKSFKGKAIAGTDLSHAYWRIAFASGLITERTYKKGLADPSMKTIRLMTLSVSGADREFRKRKGLELTPETVIARGDENLKNIFKFIRNTCFQHMNNIAEELGADFVEYRTDAIYYLKSDRSRKIVERYCRSRRLHFSHLE